MQKVKKTQKATEDNAARTVTIIPIIFLVCHMPIVYRITSSFVITICHLSQSKAPSLLEQSDAAKHYVSMISHFILPTINSCINPFVYLLGSNKLKTKANAYAKECVSKFGRSVACQDELAQKDVDALDTMRMTKQTTFGFGSPQ